MTEKECTEIQKYLLQKYRNTNDRNTEEKNHRSAEKQNTGLLKYKLQDY